MRYSQTQKPALGQQINWAHPLVKGLVGCWLMGPAGVIDYGPNILSTAVVGDSILNGPDFITLGGTNDYLTIPRSINYNPTEAVSIVSLCYPTSVAADGSIISKTTTAGGTATPFDCGFYCASGTAYLKYGSASAIQYRVFSGQSIPINCWSTLVYTHEGAITVAPKFYLNGIFDVTPPIERYSGSGTGMATSNVNPILIGNRTDEGTDFLGSISYVLLYNRALTPQEVAQLYQSPYAMFERRPVWMNYTAPAVGLSIPVAMLNQRYRRI